MLIKLFNPILIWILYETVLIASAIDSKESMTSLDVIRKDCNSSLKFKSIDKFLHFMEHFKQFKDFDSIDSKSDTLLKRCIEDRESLYALEELVSHYDKKRPCKFKEVAKLEEYAKKFLIHKRPISIRFFTLFGVNVGFHCKVNLLAHLKQADTEVEQLDFFYSISSPTGWNVLINEYTKKTMKFGTSSNAGNGVINRVAKLVPGLAQIDELDYLSFDHVKNNISIEDWQGVEYGSYKAKGIELSLKVYSAVEQVIQSCQNLDQFYVNSVLSLARLNELGLLVSFDTLNELHEYSLMLHKWLVAASFCQLLVRVKVHPQDDVNEIKFRIEHNDNRVDSRRKLYSYVAEFKEIAKEAVDSAWLANVRGGQWRKSQQAMFRPNESGKTSVAMKQFKQFLRGLERDYQTESAHSR